MGREPVITKGKFDSQNLAFWDSVRGRYVAYFREMRGPNDEIRPKGPQLGLDDKGPARDVTRHDREPRPVAAATGGRPFRADDREQLEDIYRRIDALTPIDVETLSYRPTASTGGGWAASR